MLLKKLIGGIKKKIMSKIIRIKNCPDCIHSYENNNLIDDAYIVCGNVFLYKNRPSIKSRIVSKTEIPNWCPLEDDFDRSKVKK